MQIKRPGKALTIVLSFWGLVCVFVFYVLPRILNP